MLSALCLLLWTVPDQSLESLRRSDLLEPEWRLERWIELPGERSGVVETRGLQQRLRVLAPERRRWTLRAVATAEGQLRRVEPARLTDGAGEDLVLFRRRRAPDETLEHVQILRFDEVGRGQVVWEELFVIPQERAPPALKLGATSPGVFIERPEGERARIVWRKGPRLLRVEGRDGPLAISVGAERVVHSWAPERGWRRRDDYVDFLEAKVPVWVEGLEEAAKDGPSAAAVVDGATTTGWSVPPEGDRSLTLHFEETVSVQMIRVVPGCVGDKGWQEAPAARSLSVSLGGGLDWLLERGASMPPGVEAWGLFPLSQEGGRQWLIFSRKARRAGWVRFEFLGAGQGCIAELSVH